MNNDTEEFIEVENESTKEFDKDVAVDDQPVPSGSFLDMPSDATTTEATSGSSIEDVPSSKHFINAKQKHLGCKKSARPRRSSIVNESATKSSDID